MNRLCCTSLPRLLLVVVLIGGTVSAQRSAAGERAAPRPPAPDHSEGAANAAGVSPRSPAHEDPDRAATAEQLFVRGVQLHQAGDLVGAIEAYQGAIEIDPARVDARSNLGAALARLGRHDQAIEAYRAALEHAGDQPQIRFNLALALYKSGRIAEARDELVRVTEADAANTNAVLLLADCHAQMGNDAAVLATLQPRETELADNRLFAYLLGNALLRRNELLRGQSYIERLFADGETAEARLLMGVAHLQRGDGRAALPELERAVALNPTLPTVRALYAQALLQSGRPDAALAEFREELKHNPNDFESNLYVGLLSKDEGKLDVAFEHLTRASRLRSQDPSVLYGLGAVHLARGRNEDARRALEAVTTAVPEYRQGHVLLATAYYRLKQKDLGDRHREIAARLEAEQQAREPGAQEDLGPAYRGESPGHRAAEPAPGAGRPPGGA